MAQFSKLITPNSGVSSTRYAGLVSLYVLIAMAVVVFVFSWFGVEIQRNNSDLLQSIAYTLGVVVAGAFVKMGLEKSSKKEDMEIKSE